MDFEEAWQEAVREEEQQRQQAKTATTHSDVQASLSFSHASSVTPEVGGTIDCGTRAYDKQQQQQTGAGGCGHHNCGAGDDEYNEFSDEDLLQSVPFANDAAVMPTVGHLDPLAPVVDGVTTPTISMSNSNAPRATALAAPVDMPSPALSSTALRGVLEFPPLGASSFLLRGDNGQVCWVTTSGARARAAPLGQSSGERKIPQPPDHPSSHEVAVVGVGATDAEDVLDNLREGKGTAPLSCSGVVLQLSDEDEDDMSRAAMPYGERRANDPTGFFRDGVNVRSMLREIYAEEMKEKRQRQQRVEHEERGRDAQRVLVNRSCSEREAPSAVDEVIDDEEKERRRLVGPARQCRTAAAGAAARPRPSPVNFSDGELWVTKYSPKLFREVLSDETINLQLLQWLKSWDAYVFPDDTPSAAKGAPTAAAGSIPTASPPAERIAVLTGPPGVGKTTLVHVLAAHCGYEVIEVNASVERTASRLEALIRTAVSAAGPAPGGRLRRSTASPDFAGTTVSAPAHGEAFDEKKGGSGAASVTAMTSAASSPKSSFSLVHHLLRPKCLVIDEMDGIASSSVAAYLVQQSLHRPVFCLCNDLYVPSLRPLRQRCSHVYHMPPIRPQRLLTRLEEIARREGATMFDSMVLSELITSSGGDVRSCLNGMQFISSFVHHQQRLEAGAGESSSAAAVPAAPVASRHAITELIRRMQGKDTRAALRDCWQLLFTRPDRNKAVQLLKQECGIDYDAFVEAAAAQHTRSIVSTRRPVGQGKGIGVPGGGGSVVTQAVTGREEEVALARAAAQPIARGFRVDPGYLYTAQKLSRCPDNSGLVDGLQESYLDRPYTDYGFSRTSATADSFSNQDVTVAAAFRQPGMMGTAERLYQVTALTCFVHCSTAARGGGRIEFPREQATLRRLQSEAQHIFQRFREGCRPHIATFLSGDEMASTDVAPMLIRCLFDRSLRLPAHAISSFSRLPPTDQRLLQTSVVRHVEYGLDYQRDRQYTPSPAADTVAAAEAPLSSTGLLAALNVGDEAPWRLTPELDKLVIGVVRPMEHALVGRGGGGYRGSFFSRSSRIGGSGHGFPASGTSSRGGGGGGGGSSSSSSSTSVLSRALPLASVMMPMRNEVRQILSGEISQYRVMQSMERLKRQSQQLGMEQQPVLDSSTSALERGLKRQRADSDSSAAAVSSTLVHKGDAAVPRDMFPVRHATVEVDAPADKRSRTDALTAESSPTTTATTVRRDFFGRPILSTDTGLTATSSTGRAARGDRGRARTTSTATSALSSRAPPSSEDAGQGSLPRPKTPHHPTMNACVRYVYQDGSTNAVKMPATFADF